MNRTYMQKGIGAAPFAIVAALIVAMAAGLWFTQPAQAAVGDVVLTVTDVDNASGFNEPTAGGDTVAYGPAGLTVEVDATREASFAKDAKNVFRGSADRGAWVEFQAAVSTNAENTATAETRTYSLMLSVTGEAQLTSAGLTSGTLASRLVSSEQVVQFPVYATGEPGGFSVTAEPAAGSLLTAAVAKKAASVNGQWVGPATSATVLTAKPTDSGAAAGTTFANRISPMSFLGGAAPGLDAAAEVGFLFQLKDAAGQVALNTSTTTTRDDLRVRVVKDLGVDLAFEASILSVGTTGGASVYVDITNENGLDTVGYPDTTDGAPSVGGLIALGLSTVTLGDAAVGRIVIDLPGGGTAEHPVSIAGHPNADMSSVSAPTTPVNLRPGAKHTRTVTLRDANGTPVVLPAADTATNTTPEAIAAELSARGLITITETKADPQDLLFTIADGKADSPGNYVITITANHAETDDPETGDPVGRTDAETRDASVGLHAFEISIDNLSQASPFKKTTDADGNSLEAHVGGPIASLSVASVTNLAGDDILGTGGEVTVNAYDLITITLEARDKDGNPPPNGSTVTPLAGTGFVGSGSEATNNLMTNDAGEATVDFRAGTATQNLGFRSNGVAAQLLVRIAAPGAEVDEGPSIYSLVSSAVSTYVSWQGGDASSSVFENVAGLVIVWKWTGTMWVGYTSSPSAPAATKTDFALSDGDVLYVVSNGPVDITLD